MQIQVNLFNKINLAFDLCDSSPRTLPTLTRLRDRAHSPVKVKLKRISIVYTFNHKKIVKIRAPLFYVFLKILKKKIGSVQDPHSMYILVFTDQSSAQPADILAKLGVSYDDFVNSPIRDLNKTFKVRQYTCPEASIRPQKLFNNSETRVRLHFEVKMLSLCQLFCPSALCSIALLKCS